MGTRSTSIRLDGEAYDRLEALKRDGESFSEVVRRITGERSLKETAGIWNDENGGVEDIREAVANRRDQREDELKDITNRLLE